ncbi:MAG: hypothetical protein AB7G11_07700 [Phycisphaerales bacterium]
MAIRGTSGSGEQALPEWGEGKSPARTERDAGPKPPRTKRRWPRRLGLIAIALVLVLALLVVFAPAIGSSLAPGIIEDAAKGQIAGAVKVKRVDLSWRGSQEIGPIELLDDRNKTVGTVSATIPVGLLTVVTERWWSKSSIDLGAIELTGDLDVVVDAAGGKSNLDRAVAPGPLAKPAGTPKSAGGGGGPDTIGGTLKLKDFNISYTDKSAPPGSPVSAGVGLVKFGGDVAFAFDQSGGPSGAGGATAKGRLAGILKGASSSSDKLQISIDADVKQTSSGALDAVNADMELVGAPVDLIDGLAGFRGELAKSIGTRAEVTLHAAGKIDALAASLTARAPGARADISATIADGVLSLDKPAVISLRQTDFIAGLPSLRARFAQVGKTVRLDAGPSVEVTINSLRLPVPKGLLTGGKPAPSSSEDLDLRAAAIDLTATIGKQTGTIAWDALHGASKAGSDAPGAPASAAAAFKPFTVDPVVITAAAPTLAGPVQVRGSTTATLEGKPAGDLSFSASAAGLLDDQGHLKADSLKDLRAQLDLKGTSTALLQPIAGMLDVPVDFATDVGPTLDAAVTVVSRDPGTGGAGSAPIPPLDATLRLTSANINADGAVKIADALTTTGDGISLRIASAGPLIQRVMRTEPGAGAAPGAGAMQVAGRGAIDVRIKDLSIDMDMLMPPAVASGAPAKPLDVTQILGGARAQADVRIDDLSVTLPGEPVAAGTSKGLLPPGAVAPEQPTTIMLSRASLAALLKPGEQPRVTLDAALSQGGSAFTVSASASAPASALSKPVNDRPASSNPIERLIAISPTIQADAKSVPRSMLGVVPSVAAALDAGQGQDAAAEAKRLISALIGSEVELSFRSAPLHPAGEPASQSAKLELRSAGGTKALLDAALTPTRAIINDASLEATVTPASTAGLLAALSSSSEGPATPAGNAPAPSAPMTLADPFTLRCVIEPYTLPLKVTKEGSVEPSWDAAPELTARLTTSAPVTIRNLSVNDSSVAASLRNLAATANVPLAKIMGPERETASVPASVSADLVRVDSVRTDAVAKLDVTARVPAGGGANLSAVAKLIDVNTAAADSILGKSNYLVGALGERIQATVRIEQVPLAAPGAPRAGPGGARAASASVPTRTNIQADLDSPRLKGASITASMDEQAIRADSARLTWTPSVDWVNDNLLGAADARTNNTPPGAQLAQETSFSLDLKKVAIARAKSEGDKPVQGPLKPGVFALDTALTSPGMTLRRPDGQTVRLDDIRASLVAPPSSAAASVNYDITIARVSGDSADSSKPAHLAGSLDHLADAAGVLTTDAAELNADGDLQGLPTALVDALANQKGLVVDALGAILTVNLKAQHLSRSGGTLNLTADAPRLDARIVGKIENGTFMQTGPMQADLTEVVAPLVKRFAGGLPLVETVVKTPQDEKGVITATNFTFPADGKDMTKFNGVITADLGTAQFEAQGFFSQLLKFAGGRRSGVIGRKIEPFTVRADHGVLTYDRFRFPLGEFTVETRGTVDLVGRKINVVTYVPLFALADETVGLLGGGAILANIKILDRNTLVPIKVSGSLDNPKAQPDAETFLKENAAKLLPDPKKLLEDPGKAIEDLLKGPRKDK